MADESEGKPRGPRRRVRVRVDWLLTIFVWAIAVVLVLRFFEAVTGVFLGVLAAGALASALRPIVRWLTLPRWLSAVIAGLVPAVVACALVGGLTWWLTEPVQRHLSHWPALRASLNQTLEAWSEQFGLAEPLTVSEVAAWVTSWFMNGETMTTTTQWVAGFVLGVALVLFGTLFMLAEDHGRIIGPMQDLLPVRRQKQLRMAVYDLERRLRWWALGTLMSMTITGAATWLGFRLVGLEQAGPLAVLAGVAEIVPTIGPAVAFLVAVVFASAQGPMPLLGVLIVWMIVQTLESFVLLPIVMRRAVDIPPVVTLFTIVLWGKIFGVAGVLLAVPINLVVWAVIVNMVGADGTPREREAKAESG